MYIKIALLFSEAKNKIYSIYSSDKCHQDIERLSNLSRSLIVMSECVLG